MRYASGVRSAVIRKLDLSCIESATPSHAIRPTTSVRAAQLDEPLFVLYSMTVAAGKLSAFRIPSLHLHRHKQKKKKKETQRP